MTSILTVELCLPDLGGQVYGWELEMPLRKVSLSLYLSLILCTMRGSIYDLHFSGLGPNAVSWVEEVQLIDKANLKVK